MMGRFFLKFTIFATYLPLGRNKSFPEKYSVQLS